MKKPVYYLTLVCILAAGLLTTRLDAQNHLSHPSRQTVPSDVDPVHSLLELQNSWLGSDNPTSIGVKTMPDIGKAQFAGDLMAGNLHRSMESSRMQSWGFGADSYRSLRHLNLWGDFSFMNRFHSDRQWSDNVDPYNGNPYQVGSKLKGDYTEQSFDFDVKLASHRIADRWHFGLGMKYEVGDLSRLNDPRSRVQFADMSVYPGMAVQLAAHHRLGVNLNYRYRKEKNNKYVSKSAGGNEFMLYRQEGLGVYSNVLSNHFERRVKGHWYGGALQYEYVQDGFSLFSHARYQKRSDTLEDLMKECPGDYSEHLADLQVKARWQNRNTLQTASLQLDGSLGTSYKNFQELHSEEDEDGYSHSEYRTLYTAKAYTHHQLTVGADYHYYRLGSSGYRWFAGSKIGFWNLADRYAFYVPASKMDVSTLSMTLEGGLCLLTKGRHRLYTEAVLAYHLSVVGQLSASPDLDKKELWEGIHVSDFEVLSSDVLETGLKLKYFFPLTLKNDGFLSFNGSDFLSTSLSRRHRFTAQLAIGIVQRF